MFIHMDAHQPGLITDTAQAMLRLNQHIRALSDTYAAPYVQPDYWSDRLHTLKHPPFNVLATPPPHPPNVTAENSPLHDSTAYKTASSQSASLYFHAYEELGLRALTNRYDCLQQFALSYSITYMPLPTRSSSASRNKLEQLLMPSSSAYCTLPA